MIKLLPLLLLLISCESITSLIDSDNYYQEIDPKSGKENLSLIFSHNINGELEPCGCRHHPLGGLSQVAGFLKHNTQTSVNFYVDIGDTFFPTSKIPGSLEKSFKYTAKVLAENLSKIGLKYMVPGDQDFAAGVNFLDELAKKNNFSYLITNLKKTTKLKHKKAARYKVFDREFILFGLVDPAIMNHHGALFNDPVQTLNNVFNDNPDYKNKEIIILSHMGMDKDKELARQFPFIKWIIGAHSQSFLKDPVSVGSTKLVQVLSRNHYLGKIKLSASAKIKDQYELVEMRQKWEQELKPNPYIERVTRYRTELNQIQKTEQQELLVHQGDKTVYKLPTAASCIECHKEQGQFWQKTAHSLAYQTLRNKKAELNPSCVGCHSLGYQKENGFIAATDIVQFKEKKEAQLKKYLSDLDQLFKKKKSIRSMKSSERKKISDQWLKLDDKYKVTHNFANVQCLNCHSQNIDHPFDDTDSSTKTPVDTNRCLSCHTADQSPEWYKSSDKTKVDGRILKSMLSTIACPKMKN